MKKERPCAQTYHFTSDEWAHGILLVARSKVEMVLREGIKKAIVPSIARENNS